ncbi:SYM1, partial [Cucurbita argyrosperma subsp. argyrosperma]
MVPCGVSPSLKPTTLCTRFSFNGRPTFGFGLQAPILDTPVRMKRICDCSSRHNHILEFKDVGRRQLQCGSRMFTDFRISASSGDGSGDGFGSGGGDGGFGGSGEAPTADLRRTFRFSLLGLALFIFTPVFLGVFLAGLVTLEGRPSCIVPKLQQEWFSSVVANWKLWIPFQFLNFRFVPQQFQVLAANVIALAWNVILSFKAHREIITR